jgi:hypothetical protein
MPGTAGTGGRPGLLQSKLVLAISALFVGSILGPVLGRALRPTLRRAVKGGILAQRALLGVAAGLREDIEDIVAEAKTELGDSAGEAYAQPREEVPQHAHGSA